VPSVCPSLHEDARCRQNHITALVARDILWRLLNSRGPLARRYDKGPVVTLALLQNACIQFVASCGLLLQTGCCATAGSTAMLRAADVHNHGK
jgi:hypothetical protein